MFPRKDLDAKPVDSLHECLAEDRKPAANLLIDVYTTTQEGFEME